MFVQNRDERSDVSGLFVFFCGFVLGPSDSRVNVPVARTQLHKDTISAPIYHSHHLCLLTTL
jgi:hypothetical protein